MPIFTDEEAAKKARQDEAEGKSPSTQAGEFIREEIHHIREGRHGARSTRQAIAIGLSKARRAGVKLPPPKEGKTSPEVRRQAIRDLKKGAASHGRRPSIKRSRAVLRALRHEGNSAASPAAISRFARATSRRRGPLARRRSALKALRTKGPAGMRKAARKAARTRARQASAA
jgi:hypothetical protein